MTGEHDRTEFEDEKAPELRRRGNRPGAGADTPSGPNTDRTVIPAKREERERHDDEDENTDKSSDYP